ncbi:proteinase T-like protein, partial [Leptotrombidium deliense]
MKAIVTFLIVVAFSANCLDILKKIAELKHSENEVKDFLSSIEDHYYAPLQTTENAIKDRYLIAFKKGAAIHSILTAFKIAVSPFDRLFKIHYEFKELNAACASMGPLSLRILRRLKQVANIQNDGIMRIMEGNEVNEECTTQKDGEWCLSRVSNASIENFDTYIHACNAGFNVTIYVVDTGVRLNHSEFDIGRATFGANFVSDEPAEDLHGHGTACASMAAGVRAGVAKNANIVAVKVLNKDGSGMISDVIAGIMWTSMQEVKGIVSISLGGFLNPFVNSAVEMCYYYGQFLAVAAGNSAINACLFSPASAQFAFTVAASNYTNELAWFTNFGRCVDIISPGTKCLLANSTTGGFSHAS